MRIMIFQSSWVPITPKGVISGLGSSGLDEGLRGLPLNPKPLNPKPLNPKPLNPKPLNP